jgi:hypothetical protein
VTTTKQVFFNLVWPAAAGNITWSFAYLAIEKGVSLSVMPRLAVLLLLGVYMGHEWWQIQRRDNVWPSYWLADGVLVATIIVFAIAVYFDKPWLSSSLIAVLVVAILGHLSGAWMPRADGTTWRHKWRNTLGKRVWLAIPSALGVATLVIPFEVGSVPNQWQRPAAILVVLLVWRYVRAKRVTDYAVV